MALIPSLFCILFCTIKLKLTPQDVKNIINEGKKYYNNHFNDTTLFYEKKAFFEHAALQNNAEAQYYMGKICLDHKFFDSARE